MISYYYVENTFRDNGVKKFLIVNNNDRRVISELDLVRLVQSNKVALMNYTINSNNPNSLTRLRTNITLPQEKSFQYSIVEDILENRYNARGIVCKHILKIKELILLEKDRTVDKFIKRLLSLITYYFSYMHDTNVRFLNIVEHKAVIVHADDVDRYLQYLSNLAIHLGMNNEFTKFNQNYNKKIESYDFVVKMSLNLLNDAKRKEISRLMDILMYMIENTRYTFVGEQMGKQFCMDILEKYKKSVFDNQTLNLLPLRQSEREAKVRTCVKYFMDGYSRFNEDIINNKNNIITTLQNNSDAMYLKDKLDKLNSYTIDNIEIFDTSNINMDNYKKLLEDNERKTKEILNIIKEQLKKKILNKLVRMLSIAANTSSTALMSLCENPEIGTVAVGASVVTAGIGTALQGFNGMSDSKRVIEKISEHAIDKNLPRDISKVLKELRNVSKFSYLCILYCYERALFMSIMNNHLNKFTLISKNAYREYNTGLKKFKEKRDKEFIKIGSNVALQEYYNSYTRGLADLMGEDAKMVRVDMWGTSMNYKAEPETYLKYIEHAWLPACRLLYDKIDFDKICNGKFENQVFFKIFEDTFDMLEIIPLQSDRDKFYNRFIEVLNDNYGTSFKRSKDFNLDVTKLIIDKDT